MVKHTALLTLVLSCGTFAQDAPKTPTEATAKEEPPAEELKLVKEVINE